MSRQAGDGKELDDAQAVTHWTNRIRDEGDELLPLCPLVCRTVVLPVCLARTTGRGRSVDNV